MLESLSVQTFLQAFVKKQELQIVVIKIRVLVYKVGRGSKSAIIV